MPRVDAVVACPVHRSFRVEQVAGMFDVPLSERSSETFAVEVPDVDEDWQIGLICGPSGSGKSTIAKRAFGPRLYTSEPWPGDRAVIDACGDLPVRSITGLFTAVGFSSPPSWVRPYWALSTGERYRCDLVRAFASAMQEARGNTPVAVGSSEDGVKRALRPPASGLPPLLVFDEFTSVVDRNVARISSAAIAKSIRKGSIHCRFVAVTCHRDVASWLEPDWVVDMANRSLDRRRLRRPEIRLEVYRCRREAWSMFARHHYLSGSLSTVARCYVAMWREEPVAFCATVSLIGRRKRWRITRIVTLPDYQGVGIGMRLAEAVAALHRSEGHRVNVTASHPALVGHCRHSPQWRAVGVKKCGTRRSGFLPNYRDSAGRVVVSFEYVGAQRGFEQ